MINYTLSSGKAHRQFIQFTAEFTTNKSEELNLQLPAWRPGRYELGNFAKNIRGFKAFDSKGAALEFRKITKDKWKIFTTAEALVKVSYEYYAAELNAGSTFLNEKLLYVNPVNCFMYEPENESEPINVKLDIPDDYILASPLASSTKKQFTAKSVHELMDSPFMASDKLQHHSYSESGCNFHIWVNGEHELDLEKVEADFRPFCKAQIEDFEGIPVDDYLFLFHFLDQSAYHGVEHEKCTVITLGPASKLLERAFYEELLGVSSHELYHTWNVKALRPKDMLPYDYSKENYSELGYVYEGVTTYMGDWYLLKSNTFSFEQYAKHVGSYLLRHFHNPGRFKYSVAESSFDTWLDGYVAGAPGRKTSIYTEGCLIAFISDFRVIKATNGVKNLASVMTELWKNFGAQGIGYEKEDYFGTLESVAGVSFRDIEENLVYGTEDFKPYLETALKDFGLELVFEKHPSAFTANT